MKTNFTFPENIADFLTWVKITTEAAWSKASKDDFFYGARWLPLSEEKIDNLEMKYSIKFGSEHRAFLQILHTINKRNPTYDEMAESEEDSEVTWYGQPSYFYNWITDTKWIESRLNWPYRTILQDILGVNRVWLKSWGPRVDSEEEKIRVFSEWYNKAPQLLPITAHTFLMDHNFSGLKTVLSVYGSDTIVAAWNLRHYLMREFAHELNLKEMVYDNEDKCFYGHMMKGIPELDSLELIRLANADIPFWKEIISYWSSEWQAFRNI
jgi:hypothetical protein